MSRLAGKSVGALVLPASFATGVRFEERQRVFSLFAEAIAGRFVHLSPLEQAFPMRATVTAIPDATGEAPVILLPSVIDDFPDTRHNSGAYRIAILRQIESFENGISTFDLLSASEHPGLAGLAEAALQLPSPYRPVVSGDLDRFLLVSPHGAVVSLVLPVVESLRIDSTLSRRFPGARGDLHRVRRHSLLAREESAPASEPSAGVSMAGLALDLIRRYALGADISLLVEASQNIPLAKVFSLASRVVRIGATVYDSVLAAVEIALLMDVPVESFGAPRLAETPASSSEFPADSPASAGGTQEPKRVDEIEFSDDDMTGTRADFDDDLVSDAPTGSGRGTSPETPERSAPTGKQPDGQKAPTLEVTDFEAPDPYEHSAKIRTRRTRPTNDQRTYFYHEWDYLSSTYLASWCRLHEHRLKGKNFAFVHDVRRNHPMLTQQVRRRFGAIRPEAWHRVHGTPDGDEISLDSLVETVVDRRSGHASDEHLYIRRERAVRDVAAAFLLDMSRSTDAPVLDPNVVAPPVPTRDPGETDPYLRGGFFDVDEFQLDLMTPKRRVIDVAKEALAVMCDALQTLGDSHAIYGFSGSGRHNVEFHVAKEFSDPTSTRTWAALGAMEPIRYTRMGPSIRHATHKLAKQPERTKVLVVVTDGYPQDEGYGPDRNDRNYGIHDTAKALEEADAAGISTFCVTIDPAGHDYLRRMCAEDRYLVIDDVQTLAVELEKVYRTLTGRGTLPQASTTHTAVRPATPR